MKIFPILFAAVIALVSCRENLTTFETLHSELTLQTVELNFGEQYVGTTTTSAFKISNQGNDAADCALKLSDTAYHAEPVVTVNADSTLRAAITFIPDRPGNLDTTLVIKHGADKPSHDFKVRLLGTGLEHPSCNDGKPCTIDWFDIETESCKHQNRPGSCDDGDACTQNDWCSGDRCVGVGVRCDDPHSCTINSCDPEVGCVFVPQHSRCSDDDPCTNDTCDTMIGCINPPVFDGTLCDTPSCEQFAACFAGICVRGPTPDGFPCEDGDVCTTGDTCQGGECSAGEGEAFGVVGPLEIKPDVIDTQVAEVLSVANAGDDQLRVSYHTEVLPAPRCNPSDYCDGVDRYAEPCFCPLYQGGELHFARATTDGEPVLDQPLGTGKKALAVERGGDLYLASLEQTPDDPHGPTTASLVLRIRRVNSGDEETSVTVVPPQLAIHSEFGLAVTAEQVALAVLVREPRLGSCGEDPDAECPYDHFSLSLTLFSRDLAIEEQRLVDLVSEPEPPHGDNYGFAQFSVSKMQLGYRDTVLDAAFMVTGYDDCHWEGMTSLCVDYCLSTSSWLNLDLLADEPSPAFLLSLASQETSMIRSTFPTGSLVRRGNVELDGDRRAEPPDPLCPEPWEELLVFTGNSEDPQPELTLVESRSGTATISHTAAIGALGRLGVLVLKETGNIEAIIPASGFIPEVRFDMSLPIETRRYWRPSSAPSANTVGSGVYAAGISETRPEFLEDCLDPEVCAHYGQRIIVAGAGCGIGTPP